MKRRLHCPTTSMLFFIDCIIRVSRFNSRGKNSLRYYTTTTTTTTATKTRFPSHPSPLFKLNFEPFRCLYRGDKNITKFFLLVNLNFDGMSTSFFFLSLKIIFSNKLTISGEATVSVNKLFRVSSSNCRFKCKSVIVEVLVVRFDAFSPKEGI